MASATAVNVSRTVPFLPHSAGERLTGANALSPSCCITVRSSQVGLLSQLPEGGGHATSLECILVG